MLTFIMVDFGQWQSGRQVLAVVIIHAKADQYLASMIDIIVASAGFISIIWRERIIERDNMK